MVDMTGEIERREPWTGGCDDLGLGATDAGFEGHFGM
jgi:hypothetical protein